MGEDLLSLFSSLWIPLVLFFSFFFGLQTDVIEMPARSPRS